MGAWGPPKLVGKEGLSELVVDFWPVSRSLSLTSLPWFSYKFVLSLWEAEGWQWALMGKRESRHFCLSPDPRRLLGLQL